MVHLRFTQTLKMRFWWEFLNLDIKILPSFVVQKYILLL